MALEEFSVVRKFYAHRRIPFTFIIAFGNQSILR